MTSSSKSLSWKTAWAKLLARAQISQFRWHDLRHHFASRLVQRGVPLNTVRDLLGHSSVAVSLRYAHLAPDRRREAVAKLNETPILALRTLDPGIMRKKLPGKGQ
jgi:site-specific recombinase XerD